MRSKEHSGYLLKKARLAAGYPTAKDFYKRFNIKASTYSAHESGRNPLSMKIAHYYSELLKVSPSMLLIDNSANQNELNKYVLHHGQVPRDTLLNNMLNESTIQLIKTAGLQKGMTIADFGCGTGSISCWLAEYVGNTGKVYAIDKGFEQLSITKRRADDLNITNIEYIRTEISEKSLHIKADMIYMRCFLHHLKNPTTVIQMAANLLSPGGVIICIEPIISTFWCYPQIPEMKKAIDLYLSLGEKNSLDFDIGTKLYNHLLETNLFNNFRVFLHQGAGVIKSQKSWIEMITSECALKYIEEGLITEEEMDSIITKIANHLERESTLATLPEFVCVIAKKN